MSKKTLRLILGDQLNAQHSWFSGVNPDNHYIMMEIGQELNYVTHHIQKISAFFLSMQKFRDERLLEGHVFQYISLNDPSNTHNLRLNIKKRIQEGDYTHFEYLLPDEYRLDQDLLEICRELNHHLGIQTESFDTEHFFTERNFLANQMKGKKSYLMETFYRQLRIQNNILMSGSEPEGGIWNLDKENRKPYDFKTNIPPAKVFSHDASTVRNHLDSLNYSYIGNMDNNRILWPISRNEAMEVLYYFIENLLPHFGDFEDAMVDKQANLFHSRLSFSMNIKFISPKEVIDASINAYKRHPEKYKLASVEGFIRQILGWREFMRGQYWAKMPEFSSINYLGNTGKLPSWFWNGKTKMNCLRICIEDSLQNAYAHHIQRLMITGNFALLSGTHPDEVDNWYLGIYIDAIEWVEITNTRGMSQWADGGKIASKPYVSSGNYISKMSNYCKSCSYKPKIRYGVQACPFNSLYWNFFMVHETQLNKNIRLSMVYNTLGKMDFLEKEKIQKQALIYLSDLESL